MKNTDIMNDLKAISLADLAADLPAFDPKTSRPMPLSEVMVPR